MLSILLDDDHEWWVSGATFDRLFQSARDSGLLPPELADWQHVANANGGFSLDSMEPVDARRLVMALRAAAERDLVTFAAAEVTTPDGSYRTGIARFLDLTAPPD